MHCFFEFEIGEPDAKNNDKASAIRSKHSVTEQRRRSKINERCAFSAIVNHQVFIAPFIQFH